MTYKINDNKIKYWATYKLAIKLVPFMPNVYRERLYNKYSYFEAMILKSKINCNVDTYDRVADFAAALAPNKGY